MEWVQAYDPLQHVWLSTVAAAVPIVLLLVDPRRLRMAGALGGARRARRGAAGLDGGLRDAGGHGAAARRSDGAAYGLFPIGWIIVNAVFLYNLTVASGQFEIVKASVARLSADRRIQALLVAFSFGAFIEGAAGFGTPVAITAALLNGLGFTPLYSAGLSLIANTAPVAFGAIGTPILTLARRHRHPGERAERDGRTAAADRLADRPRVAGGDDERVARAARRLAGGGRERRIVRDRPVPVEQLRRPRAGRHHRRPGVARVPRRCSARGGSRAKSWEFPMARRTGGAGSRARSRRVEARRRIAAATGLRSRAPGCPGCCCRCSSRRGAPADQGLPERRPGGARYLPATGRQPAPHPVLSPAFDVPALHRLVFRDYPVESDAGGPRRAARAGLQAQRAEAARFNFNWLSATGTAILLAALVTVLYLRIPPARRAADRRA